MANKAANISIPNKGWATLKHENSESPDNDNKPFDPAAPTR